MDKITDSISLFFRNSITIHQYEGFASIDMPMLNWDNDFVRFYMEEDKKSGMLKLSDSCDTFNTLSAAMLPDNELKNKWEKLIGITIDRFGAVIDDNHEISMTCPIDKAGIGCFMFGQALSSASASVGSSTVVSRMKEKTEKLVNIFRTDLDRHNCKYEHNHVCKGNKFDHSYDFLVNGRQDEHNLIKLLSEPSDNSKLLTVYDWLDIPDEEKDSMSLYAISRNADKSRTDISRKISSVMKENNIIMLSYEKDREAIEKYILAS